MNHALKAIDHEIKIRRVAYFYSAAERRSRGALWPSFAPALEGIPELDNLLGGGIPRGGITEITGSATTGRTSVALSLLAQLTRKGGACAWVDVQDALDPETAAAHGICLERCRGLAGDYPIVRVPRQLISLVPHLPIKRRQEDVAEQG
jgi:RecA/RadA recombinase